MKEEKREGGRERAREVGTEGERDRERGKQRDIKTDRPLLCGVLRRFDSSMFALDFIKPWRR